MILRLSLEGKIELEEELVNGRATQLTAREGGGVLDPDQVVPGVCRRPK